MFRVVVNGFEYRVRFHHWVKNPTKNKNKRNCTTCWFQAVNSPLTYFTATVVCNPADKYSRYIGKKLSLAKVINDMFSREERKQIFDAFEKTFSEN